MGPLQVLPLESEWTGENYNEGVLHTSQITTARTLPLEAVKYHTQDTPFLWVGMFLSLLRMK